MENLKSEWSLRPVDLARAAGISTQQVRNDLDDGVLPPARWTASGQRRFTERHRRALLAYRAVMRAFGKPVAVEIMQAVHGGDVGHVLELVDRAHADLQAQRESTRAVGEALAATASAEPPPQRVVYRIGALAELLGVRASALRVWETEGLLRPDRDVAGHRRYGGEHVHAARMVAMLRRSRYPVPQIREILAELARTRDPGGRSGSVGRGEPGGRGENDELRRAVRQRQDALTARSRAMLAAAARLDDYLDG